MTKRTKDEELAVQKIAEMLIESTDSDLRRSANDLAALCFISLDYGVPREFITPIMKIWEPLSQFDM